MSGVNHIMSAVPKLLAAGVELIVTGDCGNYVIQSWQEAQMFLNCREVFFAMKEGVPVSFYRDWKRAEGKLQCTETTRKGGRCRNVIDTEGPRDWTNLSNRGAKCHCHGGGKEPFTL